MLLSLKKSIIFMLMTIFSLFTILIPVNETFAAYRTIFDQHYKIVATTSSFKYEKGGLGIKIYCADTKGQYQKMYLQRWMGGKWVTRGTRDIRCARGSKGTVAPKYNYFYISNTVSGANYRLHFKDPFNDARSLTYIKANVNPN